MSTAAVEIHVHYERPLTATERWRVLRQTPDHVHWAPGQDGTTAYWFEVSGRVGNNTLDAGAFYVMADTPEAAQRHAALVGELFRDEVEQELRKIVAERSSLTP